MWKEKKIYIDKLYCSNLFYLTLPHQYCLECWAKMVPLEMSQFIYCSLWYYSQITLVNIKWKIKFLLASFGLIILLYTTVKILCSKVQNIAYKYRMNMYQNGQANNKEHQKGFRKRGYIIQMLANYAPEIKSSHLIVSFKLRLLEHRYIIGVLVPSAYNNYNDRISERETWPKNRKYLFSEHAQEMLFDPEIIFHKVTYKRKEQKNMTPGDIQNWFLPYEMTRVTFVIVLSIGLQSTS